MTLKNTVFAIMFAVACTLVSCTGDGDVSYSDDVAISSFTLGTVNCKKDTTTYSYSAASFFVRIDQLNDLIYNADSLVVGTVMTSVPTTITTTNNGVVLVKNVDNDVFSTYSSGMAIDYSRERVFRVVAADGKHMRDYKVNIVAHQEREDDVTWGNAVDCNNIAGLTNVKAVYLNDSLYILGHKAGNTDYTLVAYKNGDARTCKMPDGFVPVDEPCLSAVNGKLYVGGKDWLYCRNTGENQAWEEISVAACDMKAFLGGVGNRLYAVTNSNEIITTTGNGSGVWVNDDMQNPNAYGAKGDSLPARDYNFVAASVNSNEGLHRVMIVANKKNEWENPKDPKDVSGKQAVSWVKIQDEDDQQKWILSNTAWNNHYYVLPRMEKLTAVYYAGGIVAMGGNNPDKIYFSPDFGVSWHTNAKMIMPKDMVADNGIAIATDGALLYIVATGAQTGKVWCGRQNNMMWNKQQSYYK